MQHKNFDSKVIVFNKDHPKWILQEEFVLVCVCLNVFFLYCL